MQTLLDALVVSDFPIIGLTAKIILADRFRVETQTWQSFLDQARTDMSLIIVDVTAIDRDTALSLLARLLPAPRVVLCSLHQNEVEVYRVSHLGAEREAAYPSLLQLIA